ncbi:MAG: tRNA (adenine(22)-N(1))-methyltransferase [Acutalibacteraceae bacterium]
MPIRLDRRLNAIASLVLGKKICDVGSDHGKLACYLVQTGRAECAIATDISAPSLQKAERLAAELGISDLVTTRVGDGLDPVTEDDVDTVVIAGMGGDLIAGILERGRQAGKDFEFYILSPNTHPERVREQICRMGHTIVYDGVAECAGKIYPVIKTMRGGEEKLDAMQLRFGKFFRTDEDFKAAAEKELDKLEAVLKGNPNAANLAGRAQLLRSALDEVEI